MALRYKLEGDILEVEETTMSFRETRIRYIYYDIKNWLVSQHGKKGDKPVQPMVPASIEWVKKYYLPKVQ